MTSLRLACGGLWCGEKNQFVYPPLQWTRPPHSSGHAHLTAVCAHPPDFGNAAQDTLEAGEDTVHVGGLAGAAALSVELFQSLYVPLKFTKLGATNQLSQNFRINLKKSLNSPSLSLSLPLSLSPSLSHTSTVYDVASIHKNELPLN